LPEFTEKKKSPFEWSVIGIPLPSTHVARTQSELQLYLDEGANKETIMFYPPSSSTVFGSANPHPPEETLTLLQKEA
jgi:hypothetical protein